MKRLESVIWGLIVIAIGIIILGNNLDAWNIDIFFDGWWALFIIVPSFVGLIKKETFFTSLLGIILGSLFVLASQDIIAWSNIWQLFLPALLIIIGLSIIFKNKEKVHINKKGLPDYVGVFSVTEDKVVAKFEGASCVSVFGGVDLDLKDAKITEDVVIDCVTVFGGIDISVPDDVIVKTSGVPIFGGADNKAKNNVTSKSKTIYINYVCVFGALNIK